MSDGSDSGVTLVLGGARSGKSAWAERRAAASDRPVLFVATATAGDAEMADRIAAHRRGRPTTWRTLELPLDLAARVPGHVQSGDLVVVDCLTIWVSNEVRRLVGDADLQAVPDAAWGAIERKLVDEVAELIDAVRGRDTHLLLVSNEVGLGLVPPYALGRRYRDLLGRVNQAAGQRAGVVVLMVAGLPVDLRRLMLECGP